MSTPLYPSYQTAVDLATRRRGIPGLPGQDATKPEVDVAGTARAAWNALFPAPPPGGFQPEQYVPRPGIAPPSAAASAAPPPKPPNAPAGPDTAKTEKPPAKTGAGLDYHERVKAVKMPDGRVVFTNVPQPGANQMDYGEAMEEVTGRPYRGGVNFIQTPDGGAVYVQPGTAAPAVGTGETYEGPELDVVRAMEKWAPPPSLESSLPELSDPVAIYERQQWLKQRKAEEQQERGVEADVQTREAQARTAVAAAGIDPMLAMQMQAEARYGPEMIRAERQQAETMMAVRAIAQITEQQNALRAQAEKIIATTPEGPQRDQALNTMKDQIDRMESDKKLYLVAIRPQAAGGLMRPDPYAAFAAMPPPAADSDESK